MNTHNTDNHAPAVAGALFDDEILAQQQRANRAATERNTRRVPLDLLQRLLQFHAREAISPYLHDAKLREHARFAEELSRAIHGADAPEEDEPEQEEIDG